MQNEQNDDDPAASFGVRAAVLRDLDDALRLARLDDDRLDADDRIDLALTRTGYNGDWDNN